MYQYKMVQIPLNIKVQASQQRGSEAASYLEGIVNASASEYGPFARADSGGPG